MVLGWMPYCLEYAVFAQFCECAVDCYAAGSQILVGAIGYVVKSGGWAVKKKVNWGSYPTALGAGSTNRQ
jgi:hypothetical protein